MGIESGGVYLLRQRYFLSHDVFVRAGKADRSNTYKNVEIQDVIFLCYQGPYWIMILFRKALGGGGGGGNNELNT